MTWLTYLDYASVFVFGLTGALAASRAQLDIVGFVFLACLTGVGGGTIRDVLLTRPVFWMEEPTYILVATIAAFEVFFTSHLMKSRYRWILWIDAFALAVAVPAGVAAAVSMEVTWPVVLIMGISTGSFGGLMRDVVCNQVPLVLKQGEPYVTCAFAGAATAVALLAFGQPLIIALVGCSVMTLALRTGSLAFGWKIPIYKGRPPSI